MHEPSVAVVYRIYTEDMNEHGVRAVLDKWFDGYTIYPANGTWQGKPEDSIVIEIIGDPWEYRGEPLTALGDRVKLAAQAIKTLNYQDAVLVSIHEAETYSV